jgi:hypothetical protein
MRCCRGASGRWRALDLVLVRGGGAVEAVITVELRRAGNGGGEQFVWHTEKENEAEELLVPQLGLKMSATRAHNGRGISLARITRRRRPAAASGARQGLEGAGGPAR